MKYLLPTMVISLSVLLTGCGGSSTSTEKEKAKTTVDETEARLSCEDLVRGQLKSPSSAQFAPRKEWTFTPVTGGYRASGWVDADNSYGASIRNTFTCTVTEGPSEGTVYRNLESFG
ncbi:Uncharacterised protein [Corynebacterium renale]|uniref:Uncharacterized protein n=1 Tax=Corynebacterium renale TaxID=1724 RepID=A0A2A9DL07_9CORY|nr:hypothetical protein ATK06_0485 [Corynebacterium renale]SQI23414.1 Uncharacterised protein [Corynebacterium renale]